MKGSSKRKDQYCVNEEGLQEQCDQNRDSSLPKSTKLSKKNSRLSLEIDCGKRSIDPSSICEPLKASCLFDILTDPCEYNNLATKLPGVSKYKQMCLQ